MEFREVQKSNARWFAHQADVSVDQGRASLVIANGKTSRAIDIAKSSTPPATLPEGEVNAVCHKGGVSLDEARAILSVTKGNQDLAKEIASNVEQKTEFDSSDVEIVAERTGSSAKAAKEALTENDGDLLAAVQQLTNNSSRSHQHTDGKANSDTEIWDPN